jgi:hypothetical protein
MIGHFIDYQKAMTNRIKSGMSPHECHRGSLNVERCPSFGMASAAMLSSSSTTSFFENLRRTTDHRASSSRSSSTTQDLVSDNLESGQPDNDQQSAGWKAKKPSGKIRDHLVANLRLVENYGSLSSPQKGKYLSNEQKVIIRKVASDRSSVGSQRSGGSQCSATRALHQGDDPAGDAARGSISINGASSGVACDLWWHGKLFVFAAIIVAVYGIYGLLQERIMVHPYDRATTPECVDNPGECLYKFSFFLVTLTRFLAAIYAFVVMWALGEQKSPQCAFSKYAKVSCSNVLSTFCQYESLKYISFPMQMLAKSIKMLPVMLWGALGHAKRYQIIDWCVAIGVCIGCFGFALFGNVTIHHGSVHQRIAWPGAIGSSLGAFNLAADPPLQHLDNFIGSNSIIEESDFAIMNSNDSTSLLQLDESLEGGLNVWNDINLTNQVHATHNFKITNLNSSQFGDVSTSNINVPNIISPSSALQTSAIAVISHPLLTSLPSYRPSDAIPIELQYLYMLSPASYDWWQLAFGVLLMITYLVADGFTSTYQEQIFLEDHTTKHNQMFYINLTSFVFGLGAVFFSNALVGTILFAHAHPSLLWDAVTLSVSATAGQLAILSCIQNFGALITAAVLTLRQVVSTLLSLLYMGHR